MTDAVDNMVQALDPFTAAAMRQRQGVMPAGGRQEGPATYTLTNYLPHIATNLSTLPQRAFKMGGDLQRLGDYDPGPAIETVGLMAGRTPFAKVGEAGVFGGKLAKTYDPAKALDARLRETLGDSASEIWNKTGFEKGAEGQYRFEIPDTQATLNPMLPPPYDYGRQTLGDVLNHPELYKAYPHMKEMPFYYYGRDPTVLGSYNPESKAMVINPDRTDAQRLSTILHETQHAIQEHEGFAPGTNANFIEDIGASYLGQRKKPTTDTDIDALLSIAQNLYRRHAGEVEARNVQARHKDPGWQSHPPSVTEDTPRSQQIILEPELQKATTDAQIDSIVKALMTKKNLGQ